MKKAIYKYKLTLPETEFCTSIVTPDYFFEPLFVGTQNSEIFIWGLSAPLNKIVDDKEYLHEFLVVPTGVEFDYKYNVYKFLGTVQLKTLRHVEATLGLPLPVQLVFHVFYVGHKNLE